MVIIVEAVKPRGSLTWTAYGPIERPFQVHAETLEGLYTAVADYLASADFEVRLVSSIGVVNG